jgi:RsiW-degrading membrane proteinase PrsW (M82 family)
MKQKLIRFLILSLINAVLYGVIIYFMEVKLETIRFVVQALFFGLFMGFLQVYGIPFLNRNKTDKK